MASPKRKITLKIPSGLLLDIEEDVAKESEKLKLIFKNYVYEENILIKIRDNVVPSDILIKILNYTKKIAEFKSRSATFEEIKAYFVRELEGKHGVTLYNMLFAAHYLKIKVFMEVGSTIIADNISGLTVEQIRDYLGIVNDFTPEEEHRIREESKFFKI